MKLGIRNFVFGLICFLSLIFSVSIKAQDTSKPILYFGPYVDLNYNYHFTNFTNLPPFPNCCPEFSSGDGLGFSAGAFLQFELVKDLFFQVRLGMSDIGARMLTTEAIGGTFISGGGGSLIDTMASVEYTINSKLMLFDIEPNIGLKVFDNIVMSLGIKAGYLFASRFDQKEEIIFPDNITFLNGSRERNVSENEIIPNVNSLQFFGTIGASYDLKIGEKLLLSPELRYSVPFVDITSSKTQESDYWKASTFQFGVSLKIPIYHALPTPIKDTIYKYEIRRDTSIIVRKVSEVTNTLIDKNNEVSEYETDESIIITTTTIEHYEKVIPKPLEIFNCKVEAYGIDNQGMRTKSPLITIEELETEEGFPLLTQIFFAEGSSDMNSSRLNLMKRDNAVDFDENKLDWNTMSIYRDVLNIIGSRLQANPDATITITGCNNNISANEVNNIKLSIDRANIVRDYLISVWKIEPPRIKIRRQNLPANPGNNTIAEGIEENQRAEISSDNFNIIKPVFLKKIQKTSNPPVIYINPEIKAEAGVKNWNIDIQQNNNPLRTFNGGDMPGQQEWLVETEPIPSSDDDIEIKLSVTDNESQKCTAADKLKIQQKTIKIKRTTQVGDKIIQKYSLILFEYDKSEMTQQQIKVLEMIRKEIKQGSKVEIKGYADRTGLPDYNRELARKRAEETKKQLYVEGAEYSIIPIGSDELIYSNDNPEGRSYCRTVKIQIETPTK